MKTLKRGSRRLLIVGADSLTSLPASKVGVKASRSRGARDLEQSARDSELRLGQPSEVFMKHNL